MNARDRFGRTALIHALLNGYYSSIVLRLLEKQADPNATAPGGASALMLAIGARKRNIYSALLVHGVTVDYREPPTGDTALILGAQDNNLSAVRLLLKHHANVNARNDNGKSALYIAAANGRLKMVKILIARGADVNSATNSGVTALQIARRNGHRDVVKALRSAGART